MGESAITRFSRTPWCHALISSPHWTPTSTDSRLPKASSEDSFFAETLATDRTIRACLTLRPTAEYKGDDGEPDKWIVYDEVRTILELGDGLNGHPKIAHGGFVATMLDEVMGVLITRNIQARVERKKRRGESTAEVMSCFTACELLYRSRADDADADDRFEYFLQEAVVYSCNCSMYGKVRSTGEEQNIP
jgi:hypothetical protein